MNLNNIKLAMSPLTKQIMMYRHGKDANTALDKREAERDVMAVLVEYMMDGAPKGAIKRVRFGSQWYEITVKPIEAPSESVVVDVYKQNKLVTTVTTGDKS